MGGTSYVWGVAHTNKWNDTVQHIRLLSRCSIDAVREARSFAPCSVRALYDAAESDITNGAPPALVVHSLLNALSNEATDPPLLSRAMWMKRDGRLVRLVDVIPPCVATWTGKPGSSSLVVVDQKITMAALLGREAHIRDYHTYVVVIDSQFAWLSETDFAIFVEDAALLSYQTHH